MKVFVKVMRKVIFLELMLCLINISVLDYSCQEVSISKELKQGVVNTHLEGIEQVAI